MWAFCNPYVVIFQSSDNAEEKIALDKESKQKVLEHFGTQMAPRGSFGSGIS